MNLLVWCPRPRSPPVSAALFLPSLLLYTGRRSSPQDFFFFFYLLTKPFFSYCYFLSHSKFGPSKVGKEHLLLGAVWCQGLQTPFLGLVPSEMMQMQIFTAIVCKTFGREGVSGGACWRFILKHHPHPQKDRKKYLQFANSCQEWWFTSIYVEYHCLIWVQFKFKGCNLTFVSWKLHLLWPYIFTTPQINDNRMSVFQMGVNHHMPFTSCQLSWWKFRPLGPVGDTQLYLYGLYALCTKF